MMPVDWFLQLVDSSAFAEPNEVREGIRMWLAEDASMHKRHLKWEDDAPYPTTVSVCGGFPSPNTASLLEIIQTALGETEYMVFAEVGDASKYEEPIILHVVTKTLVATMSGPTMVQELVKQLHVAAEPATNSAE
jgi:hypothetical protein